MNIIRDYTNCKYYWRYVEVEVAIFIMLECDSTLLEKKVIFFTARW